MDALRVGVVVPMVTEASILFEELAFSERRKIGIWQVHERREIFGDREVIVGVTIGGIGMVNAGMATAGLIHHWKPDVVALVGCAGAISPEFLPGDVAIGRDLCYYSSYLTLPDGSANLDIPGIRITYDYSLTPDRTSFASRGERTRYIHSDSKLIDIALEAGSRPGILTRWPDETGWPSPFPDPVCAPAVIGTADQINSDPRAIKVIRDRFGVQVEDCETTAAAHAALSHKVPFVAVRGISDNEMVNPAYGEFLRSGKGNLGWVEKESTRNAWAVLREMIRLLSATEPHP